MQTKFKQNNHIQNEYIQIFIRFGIAIFVSLVLTAQELLHPQVASSSAFLCVFFYLFIVGIYILWLKYKPEQRKTERVALFMIIDIMATILVIYLAASLSALFVGFLLLYIVGFGMRFGTKYAMASTVIAVLAWLFLIQVSPFWSSQSLHAYGWLIALIILPTYIFLLLKRLNNSLTELNIALNETERLANYDTLTQLSNRHHFSKVAEGMLQQGQNLTIFMFDLDGFKSINDQFGHDVGDQLLIDIANALKKCIANIGVVGRLGGDEFIVAIPDSHHICAKQLAGTILTEMGDATLSYNKVSASIGICLCPGDAPDLSHAKSCADTAMYVAKRRGKNCYQFYSELKTVVTTENTAVTV